MKKDKVLKVALFSRHTRMGASSRLRSMQYLPFLEDKKITVDVFPLYDSDYLHQLYAGKGRSTAKVLQRYLTRLYRLFAVAKYDVIWIEKELFPYLPAWAEALIAKIGKPYVVDYDDAVFHHYDLSNHKVVRLLLSNKINKVMHNAATVIVGNTYLAERAVQSGSKNVVTIPTVLDHSRYQALETDNEIPIIGWIGSPTTEIYVLELKNMFLELQKKVGFKIHLVGATQQMQDQLNGLEVEILPWSENTEASYIEQFDIGIMPLIDGPWEKGKCGYKLLQYMACAKPVVASPVGVNVDIITSCQCGYLANSLEQWDRALNKLLHSKEKRKLLGDAGKESVRDFYSLQVQAPLLADVFQCVSHR
ncbi:glycosyltransferase family 4 protein [Psychrobacter sp. 1U2]|uniref:glycosyltransferase family 4 protein n=1 Tax=Psychrobacter sp. 1U2 TaxID=3453577 RepID=UPI003F478618